jgi:hypothetical protein
VVLFFGFSDDRQFFVLVLILFVFFVLRLLLTWVQFTNQVEPFSVMCGFRQRTNGDAECLTPIRLKCLTR